MPSAILRTAQFLIERDCPNYADGDRYIPFPIWVYIPAEPAPEGDRCQALCYTVTTESLALLIAKGFRSNGGVNPEYVCAFMGRLIE